LSPSCPKAKFITIKKDKQQKEIAQDNSANKLENFVKDIDKTFSKPKSTSQQVSYTSSNYNKKQKTTNDLDPMDPSSYSDVPRGKWSAGLDNDA
jgi:polyglutamine-binding protein 1